MYLDPEILEQDNRTQNTPGPAGPVIGFHYFLLLQRRPKDRWLITPTFSRPSYDRIRLAQSLKSGPSHRWRDRPSYMYKWEFWIAPTSAVVDASEQDSRAPDERFGYALDRPDALRDLSGFYDRTRAWARPCAENRLHRSARKPIASVPDAATTTAAHR